jgi:ketosteroid isomerase-like protein
MNRRLLLIVIVSLVAELKLSAQCVKGYTPRSADEFEIVRLENEWCDAAVKRDATRLSHIFADDISWIEDVGYRNKRGVMNRYMVEIQEQGWQLLDVRIRIEGNVGIVSSHIHVIKTIDGTKTDTNHTATDVFLKRNGKWQLIIE